MASSRIKHHVEEMHGREAINTLPSEKGHENSGTGQDSSNDPVLEKAEPDRAGQDQSSEMSL